MKTQAFPFTNCLIIFYFYSPLIFPPSVLNCLNAFSFFFIRRFAVPVEVLLHKVHTLAGNGVSDYADRLFKTACAC